LLDEPTNGLDPEGRLEMLELIRELAAKRGVTVLLSSHLMPDVQHVCDRVIVITKGKIVQDSRIDELTAQRHGFFEVRVRDNKEAFVAALEENGCTWRDQQNRNILVTKPEHLEVRAFFEIARARGTQIRHLQPVRQSLEEAFMKAVATGRMMEANGEAEDAG
jgi:ABC-2 type transport system ATP-binding protein